MKDRPPAPASQAHGPPMSPRARSTNRPTIMASMMTLPETEDAFR